MAGVPDVHPTCASPSRPMPDDRSRSIDAAVAFIVRSTARRPQTEAEIDAKLSARGYGDDVRAAALERSRDGGVIDDAAFAKAWVNDRGQERGYGVPRLRRELRTRGVPTPIVDEALDDLAGRDPHEAATRLARERLRHLPDGLGPEVVARRLLGFLVRRGYSAPVSRNVAIAVSGLDREWD